MSKNYFDQVDYGINFPESESKLLDSWHKKGLVKKYLRKNNNSKKIFSFIDGPITANNPMGVHHAWGRTYKDLWQRFNNMRGYKQRFQNGFDCQGLWVEVEVEKDLGLKNKKEIENLIHGDRTASIAKFVDLCRERVFKYANIQTEQSKRLGYFMDWDNSYYTLSDDNNYMIWHFLKKCHEKGLIYKGRDSVPWCPRCGTAISQHEMLTEDYKEAVHESVFFALPVLNKDFSILVWTTTPWTIPANVAVAVHPDWVYKVWQDNSDGRKYLILSAGNWPEESKPLERTFSLLSESKGVKADFKEVESFTGSKLVESNLHYSGPFDNLPVVQNAKRENENTFHSIIPAKDLVTAEEGTGIVHIAPGAGTEDFALGKEFKLPVIAPIDEEANYFEGFDFLSDKNAKKHPELVIDYLKQEKKEYFVATHQYKHRYPACWRCKTELVWRVVDEWYIAIDPVRSDMKKVTKKIKWIPEFGLKRELDWLNNMHDWLISKKRYWGLALPIWECNKCGKFELIGSYEELKSRSVEGWNKFEGHTPHKPWIDEVKIKCATCGEISERIPDVGNPWLDAGIVPFSTITKGNFGKPLYWSDFKEWEKWFPADFVTESFPGQFKNWFYSLIAMSTVLENRLPFKTVLGFATLLAEDSRPMHKSWGNAIEFNEGAEKIGVDVMRWMYVRQNPSENLLFGYKVADETRRKFHLKLWNVYNYFVTYANLDGWVPSGKLSHIRVGKTKNLLDKWILIRLSQVVEKVTHYLDNYDAYKASGEIEEFIDDLSNWYVRRSRDRTGFATISISDRDDFYKTSYYVLVTISKLLAPFTPFISEFIYTNLTKEESVHLTNWSTDKIQVDENLLTEMVKVRELVERIHSERKKLGIPVRQPLATVLISSDYRKLASDLEKILLDEVNVKKVSWIKSGTLKIKLDTKITPELAEEANLRKLVRQVQEERKKQKMSISQKINLQNTWFPQDGILLEKLKKATLAVEIKLGDFSVKKG